MRPILRLHILGQMLPAAAEKRFLRCRIPIEFRVQLNIFPGLFSTYSAPSAVYAENIQLAQGSISPVYQHNIAITKYLNISASAKE